MIEQKKVKISSWWRVKVDKRNVSYHLSEDLINAIDKKAKQEKTNKSALVEKAIKNFLKQ